MKEKILEGAPQLIRDLVLTPNGTYSPVPVNMPERFGDFQFTLDLWIDAWFVVHAIDELEPGYADELIDMEKRLAETEVEAQYVSGIEASARDLIAAQSASLGRVEQWAAYSDERLLKLEQEVRQLYSLMNDIDSLDFLNEYNV